MKKLTINPDISVITDRCLKLQAGVETTLRGVSFCCPKGHRQGEDSMRRMKTVGGPEKQRNYNGVLLITGKYMGHSSGPRDGLNS